MIKPALSLVFRNSRGEILAVRRSLNKPSYPGFWSLPSVYLMEGETIGEAGNRLAREKLGLERVEIEESSLGSSEASRSDHVVHMEDYNVLSFDGDIRINNDEYTEMRWVTPVQLKELLDSEHDGE